MVSFFLYYSLLGSKQSVYFYWEVGLMEEKLQGKIDEISRIFKLQQEYKHQLRQATAKERKDKLKRLMAVILENSEAIGEAIYKDFRKPYEEVLVTEIVPLISSIKHSLKNLNNWMKPKRVRTPFSHITSKSFIRREPKGVSLILSPWNFPFQLAIDPLIYAVAAGNCVILKPSEFSPNTTDLIKNIVAQVFQDHEVAVFDGDYRIAEKLLELPFDNIFFTGSPAVGRKVMAAAAKNLATVTLELGGKSPVIIDSSADLEKAAERIVWGKTMNGGQICVAPDYLFIPKDKEEEFIQLAKKYINKFYGDMKAKEGLKYSSIINSRHFERIKGLIEEAVSKGAIIASGGNFDEALNLITPTLLTKAPLDSEIMEEEIFGPVLPIIPYEDIKEVYAYIKSKPKPLALYIFGKDKRAINEILSNTESGDVCINNVILHVSNVNLPFGGFNNSGIGKTHGYHGFMAFTHERSVLKQGSINTASLLYPPFKPNTNKLVKILMKLL